MDSVSGNDCWWITPSMRPGNASARPKLVIAPPELPNESVYIGTPKVSMKCSLPMTAASAASVRLQLLDGCCSVLLNTPQPSDSRSSWSPVRMFTPSESPCTYQPPAQPVPCTASSRRFQPLGGVNGVGATSVVGSWSTAFW